jgi:branched-chain amino acid transport system substrate-binding protein
MKPTAAILYFTRVAGRLASFAALSVTALPHGSFAQQSSPKSSIKIGYVCPFTGGSQDFGNSARLGAELAVAEINQVGGYLGRPLELVVRDDRSNPDEGRKIAEELVVREKVAFTIGYCNTGVALKSLDVYQANQHLLMIPQATGTAVTAKFPPESSFIFRIAVRDADQAAFLADEVVDRAGFKRIAIFGDNTGYGQGGITDIKTYLAEKNIAPVFISSFDTGVSDLADQVRRAKEAGAEAIIGYTLAPEFTTLVRARASAKFTGPIFGAQPLSFNTVFQKAGAATDGARVAVTFIEDISNERRASFMARLRRHAGTQAIHSTLSAAQSYDAVHLMLRALFQSGGDTSGPALKQALENLKQPYRGVITTHTQPFSSTDHDAFTKNMMWLGVWRQGQIAFAHSEDAKSASIIRVKRPR